MPGYWGLGLPKVHVVLYNVYNRKSTGIDHGDLGILENEHYRSGQ